MFEREENEMHFKTIITVIQILKSQACGFGGQVGETEMALKKQWGRVARESRELAVFTPQRDIWIFLFPGSILGGSYGLFLWF